MKKRLSRTLKETLFLEEGFFARLEDLPNQIAQGHQQQARAEEELRAELAQLKDTLQEERETWQRTARELNERAQAQTEAMRQELLHAIDELRETTNLIARRITLRPNKIKCLMLVHHIEAWDSLAGVHAAMQESPDFQVTVASIPRRFPGAIHFENEDQIDARLTALGVEHIRLGFEDDAVSLGIVKAINPDIIFRQSQWDDDVQPAFATASLSFARLCFVPYEAMNLVQNVQTDENVIDSATDTVFHRACWMIFCANEQARQQAVAHGALSGEQFHATGHPKGDRLRTAKPSWPIKARGRPRPLRIIWSAHHSIDDDWTRFGLFPRIAQDMLDWARTRTDVDIVFSPHPALLTQLQNDSPYMPHRQSEAFFSDWNALPNTAIFTGGDYGPLFQASDLLMTDGVSWLIEYLSLIHI